MGRRGVLTATFLLAFTCAIVAPASASHPRRWVVIGSITGSYSNDVTWVNCPETGASGTAREHLMLNAKIGSGPPALLSSNGLALAVSMRPGGAWRVTGSYPPRVEQPDGSVTCPAQRPIRCAGKIKRVGPAAATLTLVARGRSFVVGFLNHPSFSEDAADGPCLTDTEALLGLQDGLMERDVFRENALEHKRLLVPRSRLRAGKAFTATTVAGPDEGCRRFHYTHCRETGHLKMTLHFAPR